MESNSYKGYEIRILTVPFYNENKYSGSFSILSQHSQRHIFQELYSENPQIHDSEDMLVDSLIQSAKKYIDELGSNFTF